MDYNAYNIIQPPFTLKFEEMPKTELKAYFKWFMEVLPTRIRELSSFVQRTPGFENWQPDDTPESLVSLGWWLATHVETRRRKEPELSDIKMHLSFPMEVPEWELTNRTFSLAMDTGMYLSRVFLHNNPSLRWAQLFGNKKDINYGQPVLVEFTFAPFNPVHMLVTLAYGLADKTYDEQRLRQLYDLWATKVVH